MGSDFFRPQNEHCTLRREAICEPFARIDLPLAADEAAGPLQSARARIVSAREAIVQADGQRRARGCCKRKEIRRSE